MSVLKIEYSGGSFLFCYIQDKMLLHYFFFLCHIQSMELCRFDYFRRKKKRQHEN